MKTVFWHSGIVVYNEFDKRLSSGSSAKIFVETIFLVAMEI